MNVELSSGGKKSFLQRVKSRCLLIFRLTNKPVIKLYVGYGNKTHCFLYGHVLALSPLPRKKHRNNFLLNSLSLLRLFMVKPIGGANVQFKWGSSVYTTKSEKDGFFKFEWMPGQTLSSGDHEVEVSLLNPINDTLLTKARSKIIIPHYNQFAFISDIDDTFLISHSGNLRKRLFVLLTENAHSRNSFEGVVNHYRLLSEARAPANTTNPFFYVSSSEWNLYDYIREFCHQQKMPDAVYLLNQLKLFSAVFKTGQNNHKTKFMRIVRILEAYPEQRFILLGDDSQEDPFIYASVNEHFPGQVHCIYIRCVRKKIKQPVAEILNSIEMNGVPICYFKHSEEAIAHSRTIGLI